MGGQRSNVTYPFGDPATADTGVAGNQSVSGSDGRMHAAVQVYGTTMLHALKAVFTGQFTVNIAAFGRGLVSGAFPETFPPDIETAFKQFGGTAYIAFGAYLVHNGKEFSGGVGDGSAAELERAAAMLETVITPAQWPQVIIAFSELADVLFGDEGTAFEAGRVIGSGLAARFIALLRGPTTQIAYGVGYLVGSLLVDVALVMVAVGAARLAARLGSATMEVVRPLVALARGKAPLADIEPAISARGLTPRPATPAPARTAQAATPKGETPPPRTIITEAERGKVPVAAAGASTEELVAAGRGLHDVPPAPPTMPGAPTVQPVSRMTLAALRAAGRLLHNGDLLPEEMTRWLQFVENHPLGARIRQMRAAQLAGRPPTMAEIEQLLGDFALETGMFPRFVQTAKSKVPVLRRPGHVKLEEVNGVQLREVPMADQTERHILIERALMKDELRYFAELSHDINAFLASRTQAIPPRDMPHLAAVPKTVPRRLRDGTSVDVPLRRWFHAGRILDYAMLRRLSIADAIREIIDHPGRAFDWLNNNIVTPTGSF